MTGDREEVRVAIVSWEEAREACLEVRREVFVAEQGVPEEVEVDGLDPGCSHALAVDGSGRPVGTARLLPGGRIGRMAVRRPWRRRGVGARLLEALEAEAARRGLPRVTLHAQVRAQAFYAARGYRPEGEEFWEAGIRHRAMVKDLAPGS